MSLRKQPMTSSQSDYRAFSKDEPSIPIFSRPWWLDATAGADHWDAVLVRRGDRIAATMPYCMTKRLGFTLITHPPLTQTLGPWIRPIKGARHEQIAHQHSVLTDLLQQLPAYDYFYQRWHYFQTNWLAFYWAGFDQTTRYTYILRNLSDLSAVFCHFSASKRRSIRKAKDEGIRITFDLPARTFYEHHKRILAQSGADISYPYDLFRRIYEAGYNNNAARTLAAYDARGNLHAAAFVVWDQNHAYDLIGMTDRHHGRSGATALLMWEEIQFAALKSRQFDFEGSMIQSVEAFVREFSPQQTPYFCISRTPSRLYAMAQFTKSLVSPTEHA
ncbi:GNAT family N-acetyltransferase [Castellaniella sp. UC4442_H9]